MQNVHCYTPQFKLSFNMNMPFMLKAYKAASEFMEYYNHRRRHGKLGNKAPSKFYEETIYKNVRSQMMIA